MSYFNCLTTITVLRLLLTVPWVGLKCVILVLPDQIHFLFICQFLRVWYISHKRTSKDQTSLHIGAVSPEPLKIALKRRDVDEGSSNFIGQLKNVWYLSHM